MFHDGKRTQESDEKEHVKNRDFSGYAFILPICVISIIFFLAPILLSLYFSFHDYNVVKPPVFTGVKNYLKIFDDPVCLISIKNIFIYTLGVVPAQTLFSLLLAVIIAPMAKNLWTGFLKGALFIPVISSYILVGIIWRIILNSNLDPLNLAASLMGMGPIMWLGHSQLSMASVILATIWKNVGYFMVLYIAGIMEIPHTYYEAARIDGADYKQTFIRITVPLLRSKTYFVVVLGTIWSFQVFDLVYALTGGGPGFSTMTLVMHIYTTAFKDFHMGYGMALSYVLLIIVIFVSLFQLKYMKSS